jgi:hypothetical protein
MSCAIGLLTLACTHATPPPSRATTPAISAARSKALAGLESLEAALERIKQSYPRPPPGRDRTWVIWQASVTQTQEDVRWLGRRAPSWPESAALDALITTVTAQAARLEGHRPSEVTPPLGLLDSVGRDIAIKAQQCRLFGGPVPVSVNVISKDHVNQEVSGYEVWFVRKGFEDTPREFRRFERHSSPAARVFNDPGYYVLWLERQEPGGARARGERVDVEIGPEQRVQEIDLLAPSAGAAP